MEVFALPPPDLPALVGVIQGEPAFIAEEHSCPLVTCPARVASRPEPASCFVGSCVLQALRWDAGMEPVSVKPVPDGLVADSDVIGTPQLAADTPCSGAS